MLKKLALISIITFSMEAKALILLQQASVSLGTELDTNPTLSSSDKQSIWRYTASPRYVISAVQKQNRFYMDGSLLIQRSSNKKISIDREDPSLSSGWTRDYDRGQYGIVTRYNKSSTRDSEFTRSGIVASDGTSVSKSIAANWSHLLTDRLNLTTGGQYLKTDFSGTSLNSYTTKGINLGLSYELTEKLSPFINLDYTKYIPNNPVSQKTNSTNYSIGIKYALRSQLNLSTAMGISHVSSVGSKLIANAGLSYLGERYNLAASAGRSVSASGLGGFQESDNLTVGYSYDLSQVSKLGVDLSWGKNRSINDSENRQISGFYTRELTPYWQMRLNAQTKQLIGVDRNSNANVFGVLFIYSTPEF